MAELDHPTSGDDETPREDESPEGQRTDGRTQRRGFLRAALTFTIVGTFGGMAPLAGAEDPDCDTQVPSSVGDRDESCGEGEADEGCAISSPPNQTSGKDVDQHCNVGEAPGYDVDNSCGDCDDAHDTDETCGNAGAGGAEEDELCGHQHYMSGAEDENCSATVSDAGCGVHKTHYGGTWEDEDQHCNPAETPGSSATADQNCTAAQSDASCGVNQPAYSTSPDECCGKSTEGVVDKDNACGQSGSKGGNKAYDIDESCKIKTSDPRDEACGSQAAAWIDYDANCGRAYGHPVGYTDIDESCGKGLLGSTDENCGKQIGDNLIDGDENS